MKSLFSPLISEKSLDLTSKSRYTFKIAREINKSELKKLIEKTYQVTVEKINIINQAGKKKRVRVRGRPSQRFGKRSDYKKAIVRLKKGQKIKGFEMETKESVKDKEKDAN
jgi:large subunit ribosomal protein L23